ncbi:energy-coupling factor ABC transporter ATP-binding protein [Bacillus rubiinfantis]|uniref:energy-coupling factor ABC transporter ATP-binding protein n=1 Tax=Bacillus rubiinfantis TaxID=1499680 RepID=UPI0005A8E72F|nr:ABC transporter ATP-binding protein [Bacillus rubiinfantis]
MIEVSSLSFSYPNTDVPVLADINLEFDQRTTAIIGQNGSGKTTFVKLLKGLLKASKGEIFIGDYDVSMKTAAELARQIGLVFQNPNDQIFKRTVLDEAMFGLLNIKMGKYTAEKLALEALEMVGLAGKTAMNPHDLSLSEKKLLCTASVVAMDTDIVIFDEPTIAQDEAGKKIISNIIKKLKRKQKLIITIIHDMDFVAENFERIIVFNQGTVILDGATREVFTRKEVLKEAKVELPGITQLANRLGFQNTVLTIEEFLQNYSK